MTLFINENEFKAEFLKAIKGGMKLTARKTNGLNLSITARTVKLIDDFFCFDIINGFDLTDDTEEALSYFEAYKGEIITDINRAYSEYYDISEPVYIKLFSTEIINDSIQNTEFI